MEIEENRVITVVFLYPIVKSFGYIFTNCKRISQTGPYYTWAGLRSPGSGYTRAGSGHTPTPKVFIVGNILHIRIIGYND